MTQLQAEDFLIETLASLKSLQPALRNQKVNAILDFEAETIDKRVSGVKSLLSGFFFGKQPVESSGKLLLDQKVNEEVIYKDYNDYLPTSPFEFSLSPRAYESIVEFLCLQYDRRLLKKSMSHLVRYSDFVTD